MKKMAVFFLVLSFGLSSCKSTRTKTETQNKPKQGNWLDTSTLPEELQGEISSYKRTKRCREEIRSCSVSKKTASECAWKTFNAQYFNNHINRKLDEAAEPKVCSLITTEDVNKKRNCKNFYYNCKESKSVELGGKAEAISIGKSHGCAILENGDIKCWGVNNYGQLGNGNNTNLNAPSAPINLGGKAKAISLGYEHSCAILENGDLKCWGENGDGRLEREIILI